MNWVLGMLLGVLIALFLWRLITQYEQKYAAKRQALIQRRLDRITDTKGHKIQEDSE